MWEKYRQIARNTREKLAPTFFVPALVTGVLTDFWSHPNQGAEPIFTNLIGFPKADITRRTTLAHIPQIGPAIADHIGNFGLSAAMMIPISATGFAVKEYGRTHENKIIEMIGEIIPIAGLAAIVIGNIAVEQATYDNHQMLGDVLFGIAGILGGHLATYGALERFQTKARMKRLPANATLNYGAAA
jgi:hypothetical protein